MHTEVSSSLSDDQRPCFFLNLPPETILEILTLAGPYSASRFTSTSHYFHTFQCYSLHKSLFLSLFDPPPAHLLAQSTSDAGETYPYREELERRCFAEGWIKDASKVDKLVRDQPEEIIERVLEALVDIAVSRPPVSPFSPPSRNQLFLEKYFPSSSKSSLILRLGSTRTSLRSTPSNPHPHTLYDMNNFSRSSSWGPFLSNSSTISNGRGWKVDWKKLEALAVVMGANLDEAIGMGGLRGEGWGDNGGVGEVERPRGWESTREGKGKEGGLERDWAGVEDGAFLGTYAFLDYRTFEHFNYHRNARYTPSLEDETEAVGDCMRLELKLLPEGEEVVLENEVEEESSDDEDEDFDEEGDGSSRDKGKGKAVEEEEEEDVMESENEFSPDRDDDDDGGRPSTSSTPSTSTSPPRPGSSKSGNSRRRLSFVGKSAPLAFSGTFDIQHTGHNVPKRSIEGIVEMTDEGVVHWSYVISYSGARQWLMHGVQLGGPRSRAGILGVWSTASHEDGGPNGPFWSAHAAEDAAERGRGLPIEQRDDEDRFDALADEAVLRFSKDVLDKIKLGVFGSGVVCGEFEKRRVLYEMKGVLGVSEEEVEKQEGREMDEKWVALATDLAETIIERVPAVAPSLAEEQLTTITSTITSIVNPVVERLYHLRLVLSARVSLRVAEFEQGVEEAAARVAKHKSLVRKLEKSASRLGELKELERRARAEAEEWEDELGRVVLGLVLLR
ncbi:F-box domain, Skp2-like domain protein [Pseudohyphozyma bogoriensis]|nr:F-box domain, Skp2-like domain protein [Pseudohyphozyma bogoriensis]